MDRMLPEEHLRRLLQRPVSAETGPDGFSAAVMARIEDERSRRRKRVNAMALAGLMMLALGFAVALAAGFAIFAPRVMVRATSLLPLVETAPLWAGVVGDEIGRGLSRLLGQWAPFLAAAVIALTAFEIVALRIFKSRFPSSS